VQKRWQKTPESGAMGLKQAYLLLPTVCRSTLLFQGFARKYYVIQSVPKTPQLGWVGLEPDPADTGNYSMKQKAEKTPVAETVADSEIPPDLQKVIANWTALPAEIKQTILTLVKHSRRRKADKVL
jgi:hypothetical protein